MEIALDHYGEFRVEDWSWPAGEVLGTSPDPISNLLLIVAERDVDPNGLALAEDPILFSEDENGTVRRAMSVASPEVGELAEGAGLVFGAIGFAIGVALPFGPYLSSEFPSQYLPDCDEDRKLLSELGSRPRLPLMGRTGTEVFDGGVVDAEFVQELARRRTLRVYPEALHDISATATFRDLWRTLELAFQAEGKVLTKLLSEFGPARRLGFDLKELEDLRATRGQISHASSRLGPREVSRSESSASEALGRLWSLVDWVILSKKDASQSLENEELRPLAAFIRRDGSTQIEPQIDEPEAWTIHYGWGASPRFHAPD
jgi:hypothetical protein